MFSLFQKILLSTVIVLSLQAQEITNGHVLSRDLITNDVSKSVSFYTSLFGWTAVPKGEIIELQKDSLPMASVIEVTSKEKAQWVPLFAHNNLHEARISVLKHSGKIIKDVQQTDGIGDFLLIKDAQGALSILTDSSSHHPSSDFPQLDEWLWDEIWSHDTKLAQAFYTELFNYEVDTMPSGYIIFKSNDTWKTGLLPNPFEKSQTQWVSTIRVNNPEATSEAAVKLGGKILVSVQEHKGHRDAALLADPTGAVFIVEKYEEKEQK